MCVRSRVEKRKLEHVAIAMHCNLSRPTSRQAFYTCFNYEAYNHDFLAKFQQTQTIRVYTISDEKVLLAYTCSLYTSTFFLKGNEPSV